MQEVLRCTEKEEYEKTTTLCAKAEKELLEAHAERMDLLNTAEELKLQLNNNGRKMHKDFSVKNDEIKALKDKALC